MAIGQSAADWQNAGAFTTANYQSAGTQGYIPEVWN